VRRALALLIVGLSAASPAWSQVEPCSTGVYIPVSFHVPRPCPNQPVTLVAEACAPCVHLVGWSWPSNGPIQVRAIMRPRDCILEYCEHDSLAIPLGIMSAGHYSLVVEVQGIVERPDSTACLSVRREKILFDVPLACEPEPPSGPLPYTDAIRIGPPPPCPTCPPPVICPERDIPFFIAGRLPDDCIRFERLELLPNPSTIRLPQPPIARVIMRVNDCLGVPCIGVETPWRAGALMPRLPGGSYHMMVEMALVSMCDSSRVDTVYRTIVPFTVAVDCSLPPAPSCFLYGWRHGAGNACDAFVGAGTPARLVFEMSSSVPIAGLQGRFVLDPPALSVTGLRPIGPASGMHLLWQPTTDGASFVLFADPGGAFHSPCDSIHPACMDPVPVLEVIASPRAGAPIPPVTKAYPVDLLASDELGRAMTVCPTFAEIAPAVICAGRSCDFNFDGVTDVRDLVLMCHCIVGGGPCPDASGARFDCNGDGHLGIDDVLCCARVILHGAAPGSTTTRPAPELQVHVGAPSATANGLDLTVRVHRADLVGAGRLVFTYPAGYQAEAELLGDASAWMLVTEAADGEMIVGMISMSPATENASDLELMLHFNSAGAAAAVTNAIELAEQEFAGRDGVLLTPSPPNTSVPTSGLRLDLSAALPNPFSRETRFVLALSRAGDAEVAVFDLSGRRVATLHRGALAAGEHTFRWDGTQEDGARTRDGVYFYRAMAGGVSATRKMVLLRGR
jgi:hypothetical protein